MSVLKSLSYGPKAWKALNGIFCAYKPPGLSERRLRETLKFNICRDLSELETRPPSELVLLKGSVCSKKPYEVELVPNYADHELVSGSRYQDQDVRLATLSRLGYHTSGVLLLTVNDGCKEAGNPLYRNLVRKYEIKGKFGIATKTFMADGITVERCTYNHIRQGALDKVLASIQANHQCLAYEYSGVDLQSQEAYDLASSGLVKPSSKSNPLIYSIKCTEFKLPYFTFEIHCINETEEYLLALVHDIGINLKSAAVTSQIRQVQFGHFTLAHALLRKHWTLENILNNLSLCRDVLKQDTSSVDSRTIKASKLNSLHIENMRERAREENVI